MCDGRKFDILALRWGAIDYNCVRCPDSTRKADRFLHRVEIEDTGPARDDNESSGLNCIGDARGHVRWRVDEYPLDTVMLRLFENIGNAAFHRLERQSIFSAQTIPQLK